VFAKASRGFSKRLTKISESACNGLTKVKVNGLPISELTKKVSGLAINH
jgi:hypothetical protein